MATGDSAALKGLIVATQMTEDATPVPCALQPVAGVALLERHLRLLRKLGIREVVVWIPQPTAPFEAVGAHLAKLNMQMVWVADEQALATALSTAPRADWLLLDASALIDHRLPSMLAERSGSRIAVLPIEQVSGGRAMSAPYVMAPGAPDRVFVGCARLPSTEVQHLAHSDQGLFGLLGDWVQQGVAEPVDLTALPTYVPDMRRDLAYYWHPIRRAEDAQLGKQILLKRTFDTILRFCLYFIDFIGDKNGH